MKLAFASSAPDLLVNWCNGVTFVAPVPGGRLGSVARQVEGDVTGWLFADAKPMGDPHLSGTNDDAERFVGMCHELGLVVLHGDNLHVPFAGPLYGARAVEYLQRIRNRIRTDLPSRSQLLRILGK